MHACPFKFNSKEKIVHICICVYVLCMYISLLFKQFLVHIHTHTHIHPTLHNWFPLSPAPQQSSDTPTLAVSFRRPVSPRRGRRHSQPFAKSLTCFVLG